MIIETKKVLKNLKNQNLQGDNGDFTFGEALSNIILNAKQGGKMKLFILAQKLMEKDELEVDDSDFSLIKDCVKTTEVYSALIAGQCELLLEEINKK